MCNFRLQVLAILTMDQVPGELKRTPRCHAYVFKNKSEATALTTLIEARLAAGRDHMHNAMAQSATPPVLENMASGPGDGGGGGRDPEKVAAQLLAFYGKHAPGTKTKESLSNVIAKCVAEGFEWLDAPLKKKYITTPPRLPPEWRLFPCRPFQCCPKRRKILTGPSLALFERPRKV